MRTNKQIVVTDWIKDKPRLGSFLNLTLSSDERRILRGKRFTDCNQEIFLQLPRKGKLNDGDILSTNESNFYVEIIAKTENLIEIRKDILLTKRDYVIKNMLKNFDVNAINTKKKFSPETGAHDHE